MRPPVPPLRWTIPGVLLAAGVMMIGGVYALDARQERAAALNNVRDDALLLTNRTATEIDRAFRNERPRDAGKALESARVDPRLELAVIVDAAGRVLYATEYAIEGRRLDGGPHADLAALSRRAIRAGRLVERLDEEGLRLMLAAPVTLEPAVPAPSERGSGATVLTFDLARPVAAARAVAVEHIEGIAAVVAGLILLTWLLLRRLVTARLSRLVATTGRIAEGELAARTDLAGGDEVALLSRAIDRMAASLGQKTEELSRSERRFRRLVEHGSDLIALVDRTGTLLYLSPSARNVFGEPAEDLIGRTLGSLVVAEDARALEQTLAAAFEGVVSEERKELRFRGAEKRVRILEVMAYGSPELIDEGRVVFNARDLTSWRRLEDQLRQAQKLEAIGRLAGGVAHDFNNLLTAILGYCDLLAATADRGSQEEANLTEIRRAAERAAELTSQLLAFGRRQMLKPRHLDLSVVVLRLEGMLRRLVGERIDLVVDVSPEPLWIRADASRLEQIIVNLVVNGRDAMVGGGQVHLATRSIELAAGQAEHSGLAPGHYAQLTVRDTGSGMSPQVRERIFEPFFTTKELGKGTGLGLATVLGIVEQSGGHIRLESEVGEGTTFEILFPRAAAEAADPAPRSGSEAPADGDRPVVLIVDADASIRRLGAAALATSGYRVLESASAREARRLGCGGELSIDLVATNIALPDGDGPALAGELRATHPGARFLFLSDRGGEVDRRRAGLSADAYVLTKPFSVAMLLDSVRALLDAETS